MAKQGFIRRNIDTREWEHFVVDNQVFQYEIGAIYHVEVIGHNTISVNGTHYSGHWAAMKGDVLPNNQNLEDIDNTTYEASKGYPLTPRNSDIRMIGNNVYQILENITTGRPEDSNYDNGLYKNNEYLDVVDVSIVELMPKKEVSLPRYRIQPTYPLNRDGIGVPNGSGLNIDHTGNIVLINDGKYTIRTVDNYPIQFESLVFDPITQTSDKLKYKWFREDEVKLEQNAINDPHIYLNGLSEDLDDANTPLPTKFDEGMWYVQSKNQTGKQNSNKFRLYVDKIDDSGLFYKNLIKNGDFRKGFSNWEVVDGTPKVEYEWDSITKVGQLAEWSFHHWSDSVKRGPTFSEILDGELDFTLQKHENFHYLTGGPIEQDKDRVARVIQKIDITKVSDWVDGNINGVGGIYGSFIVWLGSYGTNPSVNIYERNGRLYPDWRTRGQLWNIPSATWRNNKVGRIWKDWIEWWPYNYSDDLNEYIGKWVGFYPHEVTCGDRVSVHLKMMDNANNLIESRYRVVNPTHDENTKLMFLRYQDLYIPQGTRSIDVEIIFEHQYNYKMFVFKTKDSDYNPTYGTATRHELVASDELLEEFINGWHEWSDLNTGVGGVDGKRDMVTFMRYLREYEVEFLFTDIQNMITNINTFLDAESPILPTVASNTVTQLYTADQIAVNVGLFSDVVGGPGGSGATAGTGTSGLTSI